MLDKFVLSGDGGVVGGDGVVRNKSEKSNECTGLSASSLAPRRLTIVILIRGLSAFQFFRVHNFRKIIHRGASGFQIGYFTKPVGERPTESTYGGTYIMLTTLTIVGFVIYGFHWGVIPGIG